MSQPQRVRPLLGSAAARFKAANTAAPGVRQGGVGQGAPKIVKTKKPSSSARLVSPGRAKEVARVMRGQTTSAPRAPKFAWASIVLVVLALIGVGKLAQPLFVNPTDAALGQRLEKNPAEFLNLAMQRPRVNGELPAEYRAGLRQLGLADARLESNGLVTFPASAWWPGLWNDNKGFAFSRRTPQPVVGSLDRLETIREPDRRYRFYRSIGGNWYLYREIGTAKR